MTNWFCIYSNATGVDLSWESDAATQRLTDQQLAAAGKTRVSVTGPLQITERWNTTTHEKETIPVSPLSVVISTRKLVGAVWVVETDEFTEGDKIRIEAVIKNPDGSTYSGPGSNTKFRVPIFIGKQGAPRPDGSQTVVPTSDQAFILPLQFISGIATFDFTATRSMWICAVAGLTSTWLKMDAVRAIVAKAAM